MQQKITLNESERASIASSSLITPDTININGLKIRRLSLGSLLQLEHIGNPFASLGKIEEINIDELPDKFYIIGEMIWIHSADRSDVMRGIARGADERRRLVEDFLTCIDMTTVLDVVSLIMGEVKGVQSVMVTPQQSGEPDSDPNGHGLGGRHL